MTCPSEPKYQFPSQPSHDLQIDYSLNSSVPFNLISNVYRDIEDFKLTLSFALNHLPPSTIPQKLLLLITETCDKYSELDLAWLKQISKTMEYLVSIHGPCYSNISPSISFNPFSSTLPPDSLIHDHHFILFWNRPWKTIPMDFFKVLTWNRPLLWIHSENLNPNPFLPHPNSISRVDMIQNFGLEIWLSKIQLLLQNETSRSNLQVWKTEEPSQGFKNLWNWSLETVPCRLCKRVYNEVYGPIPSLKR